MTDITAKYFEILADYFDPLCKRCSTRGYSSAHVAACIAELYDPQVVKAFLLTLSNDLKALDWLSQMDFVKSIKGQKTGYLGNSYLYSNSLDGTFDFLKKTALYSDTTIINDLIVSELIAWEDRGCGEDSSFNLIAQYAVRLLKMKELFSLDSNTPICCLAPCSLISLGSKKAYSPIDKFIEEYVVPKFAQRIFNKEFQSSDELTSYLGTFISFDDFISVVQKSGVPFTNQDGSLVTLKDYSRVKNYYENRYEMSFDSGKRLFLLLRGRYSMPAYDLAVNGRIATNYATDFKGVWDSFVWMLNNDNQQIAGYSRRKPLSTDTLVLNSLQKQEFRWIGNVPLDKIIEMRKRGELQDMRELLSRSINEIETSTDDEFNEVGRQVEYNIEHGFLKHQNEIRKLRKDYETKYKIEGASIVLVGAFSLVAAMYPPLSQSVGFLSSTLFETVPISKLIKDFFSQRSAFRELQQKPVGILFDAKKKGS
jgi:hypothetical protein